MDFILLYIAGLFLLMAILIKKYKFYWLISGYNTASKERKAQIDKEGLGQFIGNYFLFLSGMLALAFVLMWYKYMLLFSIVLGVALLSSVYVIYGSQKYDKGAYDEKGRLKMGPKISMGITVLVLAGAAGIVIYGQMPTKYVLNEDSLTIEGQYGETIAFKTMEKVELVEELPEIQVRTNGYSFNNVLKGNFKLDQLGKGKLFIKLGQAPYIIIHTSDTYFIINDVSPEKTEELYEKIRNSFDNIGPA